MLISYVGFIRSFLSSFGWKNCQLLNVLEMEFPELHFSLFVRMLYKTCFIYRRILLECFAFILTDKCVIILEMTLCGIASVIVKLFVHLMIALDWYQEQSLIMQPLLMFYLSLITLVGSFNIEFFWGHSITQY